MVQAKQGVSTVDVLLVSSSNAACALNCQSDLLSSLFATGAIFGVPLAVLHFSYSHIFREANKHIKAIKELQACLPV